MDYERLYKKVKADRMVRRKTRKIRKKIITRRIRIRKKYHAIEKFIRGL